MRPTLHHIPICPFCQRVEILLELKGQRDAIQSGVVDITKPREPHILALTGGSTALPVLELEDGRSLKESLVLMAYVEDALDGPPVRRTDPYERAVENLLVSMASPWIDAGYSLALNQDPDARQTLADKYLAQLGGFDAFLRRHATGDGPWLFDRFGWAEAVYTPFFQRFVINRYYEGVDIPNTPEFDRVRAWRDACVAHPSAQQTSDEEVIKLYYDYARGYGNGAVPTGRTRSSFVFEPNWRDRPMPPPDKYVHHATDAELGLI
jgi:glutathione S-transferase